MSEGGNMPGDLLVVTKAYSRRMDDEITIQPGQTVKVITNDAEFNDGWYIGRNLDTGFEGLFPRLFTRPKTQEHERVVSVKNTMQDIDNALAALRNSSMDMLKDDRRSVASVGVSLSDAISQESEPFTPGLEIANEAVPTTASASHVIIPPEENVPMWTPQQVSAYFLSKGFDADVAGKFQERGVTGARLLDLQLSDLKEIQIDSFGARFEVFKLIDSLRLFPVRPTTPHIKSAGAASTKLFESPGKAPQPPSYPSPVQPRMSPLINKASGKPPQRFPSPSPSPVLRHSSQDFRYPPIEEDGDNSNNNASFNFPSGSGAMGNESPILAPVNLRTASTASSTGNNSHDMGSFSRDANKSNGATIATSIGEPNSNVNAMLRQKKPQHKKSASNSSFVDLFNRISMLSVTDETFNEDDTLTYADTTANNTTTHMSRPASAIYSTSHSRSASGARPASMIYSTSHSRTTSAAANQHNTHHARTPSTSGVHSMSPSKSGMYGHSRTPSGANPYSSTHTRTPSGVNHLNTHARTPSGLNYSNSHARTPSGVNYGSHARTPSGVGASHASHPRTPSTANAGSHSRSSSGVKSHVRQVSLGNSEVKKSRRSSVLSFLSPSKKNKEPALEKSQTYGGNRDVAEGTPSGRKHDSSYSRKSSAALTSVRHQSLGSEAVVQTSTTNSSGNSNPKTVSKSKSKFPLQKSAKKKQTSAFQEGIRTISVEKAMLSSDCSGWMSKKGTGTMGVWKTRFFTLHGSRLSYFSNTEDSKERGLIDITGHKVVPIQDDDTLISLYAASIGRGKYFFKLVPPQPGFKKGLTFTQPRVHYFAVDSMDEMRSWVAALIKANIELDDSTPIIGSYNMPTVSLSKAQDMLRDAKEEMTRRDQDRNLQEADEDELMWEEQKKKNDMLAAGFI